MTFLKVFVQCIVEKPALKLIWYLSVSSCTEIYCEKMDSNILVCELDEQLLCNYSCHLSHHSCSWFRKHTKCIKDSGN